AALLTARAAAAGCEAVPVSAESASEENGWIRKAQTGDSAAFEALYRTHVDKVYGLCLRMTGNVAEAEDCTQDAFIQAWSKLNNFRGESAFSTWLHRVAVNNDAAGVMVKLQAHYAADAIAVDHIDGLSMEFAEWRFNIRSSNTEPLVRLNVESRGDKALMEARTEELLELMS
ncbi:MAG: sigma-70 family RNA polymerase sigma factor, partial [Gammaproteobacteria bacterium]